MSELVERIRSHMGKQDVAILIADCRQAADMIEHQAALLEEAKEALKWFIENDDTNEGDEPLEEYGYHTWNEMNAFWIEGLNRGKEILAKLEAENVDA